MSNPSSNRISIGALALMINKKDRHIESKDIEDNKNLKFFRAVQSGKEEFSTANLLKFTNQIKFKHESNLQKFLPESNKSIEI